MLEDGRPKTEAFLSDGCKIIGSFAHKAIKLLIKLKVNH